MRSALSRTLRGRGEGRPRGERGAAAVEFAIVVGLLLTIVFGTIDFGMYFNAAIVVNNAAREGVRAASFNQAEATVKTVTRNALTTLPDYNASTTQVYVTCTLDNGSSCTLGTTGASGGTVVVRVTMPHTWMTPMLSGAVTIDKSSSMRVE